MPTLDTVLVYPGGCLLEGTNLSEGSGTTRPFELVGAPWLDGRRLAELLNQSGLPGFVARPITFCPIFHKFAGQLCRGVQIHPVNRDTFLPYATYLTLIGLARSLHPEAARLLRSVATLASAHHQHAIILEVVDRRRRLVESGNYQEVKGPELQDLAVMGSIKFDKKERRAEVHRAPC